MSKGALRRNDGRRMNGIHGLYMPAFVKVFCKCLAQAVIVHGHKGLTFFSNELEKTIIVSASENRHFIKLGTMQFHVIIEESIHFRTIQFKNLVGYSSKVVCT